MVTQVIVIAKSTILAILLATLCGLSAGFIAYKAAVIVMWERDYSLIRILATCAGFVLGAWGGWALAEWFTH